MSPFAEPSAPRIDTRQSHDGDMPRSTSEGCPTVTMQLERNTNSFTRDAMTTATAQNTSESGILSTHNSYEEPSAPSLIEIEQSYADPTHDSNPDASQSSALCCTESPIPEDRGVTRQPATQLPALPADVVEVRLVVSGSLLGAEVSPSSSSSSSPSSSQSEMQPITVVSHLRIDEALVYSTMYSVIESSVLHALNSVASPTAPLPPMPAFSAVCQGTEVHHQNDWDECIRLWLRETGHSVVQNAGQNRVRPRVSPPLNITVGPIDEFCLVNEEEYCDVPVCIGNQAKCLSLPIPLHLPLPNAAFLVEGMKARRVRAVTALKGFSCLGGGVEEEEEREEVEEGEEEEEDSAGPVITLRGASDPALVHPLLRDAEVKAKKQYPEQTALLESLGYSVTPLVLDGLHHFEGNVYQVIRQCL